MRKKTKSQITITIDTEVLKDLDNIRKLITRSAFIENIVKRTLGNRLYNDDGDTK